MLDTQYALATLTPRFHNTDQLTKMQAAVVHYYNRLQPSPSIPFEILN